MKKFFSLFYAILIAGTLMADVFNLEKVTKVEDGKSYVFVRNDHALKAEVAGNVMIALIKQETYLLERQIARLAADFEQKGGFTERLYRIRSEVRKKGIS